MNRIRQQARLWSAVLVCAILVPIGFICYLVGDYLMRLWRDIHYLMVRRRHVSRLYKYSQNQKIQPTKNRT